MKKVIGNEPIQKMTLTGKLRMLSTGTRIVQDQAVMLEAAQKLEERDERLMKEHAKSLAAEDLNRRIFEAMEHSSLLQSNAASLAFHLEQGEDNAGISREALAKWLRNLSRMLSNFNHIKRL